MDTILFSVIGWAIILYLLTLEPTLEQKGYMKFDKELKSNSNRARANLYKQGFFRNWTLGILVAIYLYYYNVPLKSLRIQPINFSYLFTFHSHTLGLIIVIAAAYFIYLYFIPIIGVHLNEKLKDFVLEKIKPVQQIAPIRGIDYFWWLMNSFTAAIEEFIYRGFIFFFLSYNFPEASIWLIAAISIFLDACRYQPRLIAMRYVGMTGIVFTMMMIIFNSLFAAMIMHIIHDIRTLGVPFYMLRKKQNTTTVIEPHFAQSQH